MVDQNPLGPVARIEAYFAACNTGTAEEIAAHFTPDAVIWDTNLAPCRGRDAIGAMWVKVRRRWGGATWSVDTAVADGTATPVADGTATPVADGTATAAIEWTMRGRDPRADGRPFAFRGSEHYAFEADLIAEIRQYWTFDPDRLDTGLVDWPYPSAEEPAT